MATIARTDSLPGGSSTPTLSTKPLVGLSTQLQKSAKPGAPRIDMQELYTALKAAVGENWNLYRESIGLYVLGRLNQEELSRRIDSFILTTPKTTSLHNQFISGILSNTYRDTPETEVAAFVSAHDKPAAGTSKQVSGDAAEQRLKTEIMALPARERHRLKNMVDNKEGPLDAFQQMMKDWHEGRVIRPPENIANASAGKTNWELEISKRFALPLFAESNEFPESDTIQKRMIPICYQEGLVGGCTGGCSDLMNVAAETYVKQQLSEMFRKVRSNGPNYIKTLKFRRRLEYEEHKARGKEIKRDAHGLLPVEQEVEGRRHPFGLEDLRFALMVGNSYVSQDKILAARIYSRELDPPRDNEKVERERTKMNGLPMTNGVNGHHHHNDDGPQQLHRSALDDALDEVLTMSS